MSPWATLIALTALLLAAPPAKAAAETNTTDLIQRWRAAVTRNDSDWESKFWLARLLLDGDAGDSKGGGGCGGGRQLDRAMMKSNGAEAQELLEAAARVAPPGSLRADSLRRLGEVFSQVGRAPEAIDALVEAGALLSQFGSREKSTLPAAMEAAEALLTLGKPAEAESIAVWVADQARGADPQTFLHALGVAVRQRSSLYHDELEACALRLELLRGLGPAAGKAAGSGGACGWLAADVGPGSQASMYYGLYRVRHAQKRHADAWRALTRAKALAGAEARYFPDDVAAMLLDLADIFPANASAVPGAAATRPPPPEPAPGAARPLTPIFVLGLPRSGTSLLEQVLASHPDVWGAGEATPLGASVSGLIREIAEWGEVSEGRLDELGERYLEEMRSRTPPHKTHARFVVDKGLGNVWHLGHIPLLMPHACILHAVRHPADVALSSYEQSFVPTSIPWSFNITNIAHQIGMHHAAMAHWESALPPGTLMTVHYSDMVTNLEATARAVMDHCGVPWDPAVLRFYDTPRAVYTASQLQVKRPIYATSLGKWLTYGEGLLGLLRPLRHVIERYEAAARLPSSATALKELFAAARARGE